MTKQKVSMTKEAARRIQRTQEQVTGQQPKKKSFTARTTSAAEQQSQEK